MPTPPDHTGPDQADPGHAELHQAQSAYAQSAHAHPGRAASAPADPAPTDPAREALIEEFGRAVQEYQRSLDLLDQRVADRLGLNRTDLRCLDLLLGPEPLSPGELAKAAHLTTGGVTTAIDRLERAGYVVRVRDTVDRRRSVVRPTERTFALSAEIYRPLAEEGAEYLRGLDAASLERLVGFFRFSAQLQTDHAGRLTEGP